MRWRLFIVAFLFASGLSATAGAQGNGGFEICAGDDARCQTPGVVGLSCLGSDDVLGDPGAWKNSGDAMRVRNGRWEMFYASNGQNYGCASVLAYRDVGAGRNWWPRPIVCAGEDPGCQTPGLVGLACFLDDASKAQPSNWQYTGDAMRVNDGRWRMFYSHNQQTYACAYALVGVVPYGAPGSGAQFRMCAGDDPSCQTPDAIAVLCDIEGGGFASPEDWAYSGRSVRVSGGQWQMLYPSQQIYACKTVIVASAYASQAPIQPQPTPGGQLPSGAVILFDGYQCPPGWTRIGQVQAPGSPVSGMSYCRRR